MMELKRQGKEADGHDFIICIVTTVLRFYQTVFYQPVKPRLYDY